MGWAEKESGTGKGCPVCGVVFGLFSVLVERDPSAVEDRACCEKTRPEEGCKEWDCKEWDCKEDPRG